MHHWFPTLELRIVSARILHGMKEKPLPAWFAAGFASVPVAILLHELGHYTAGRLLGWRDLAFHYSRVNIVSGGSIVASAIHAPWKAALMRAAGPAVSLTIIFVAALLAPGKGRIALQVGRPGRYAVPAALGLSSAVRFFWPLAAGAVLLLRTMLGNPASFHPDLDDFNFAANLGISPLLSLFSSFFGAFAGFFWMARHLWHRELALLLVSLVLGTAAGFAFYFGFLGPHLLP